MMEPFYRGLRRLIALVRVMFGVFGCSQADFQCADIEPKNLEEQALRLVGRDIYERLIKGYTEKQWGRPCTELPAFIIRRLPVRMIYGNNYFSHPHQGISVGGYTAMVRRMLEGIEVRLGVDYLMENDDKNALLYGRHEELADKEKNIRFAGRLGTYRYMDMDQVIHEALEDAK